MFFRREKPREYSFQDRLQMLKDAGFTVQSEPGGKARVSKLGCAAILTDRGTEKPDIGKAGVVMHNGIAQVVHGGYQMFLRTADGKMAPALATHLKNLHAFEEDMKEALGMTSLYNQSLGTRADEHLYDRVEDRDAGGRVRVWEAVPPTE